MPYKASAPGSMMLLGEYAVLGSGKQALVCAIDKRITVTVTPRMDQHIEIHAAQGAFTTKLHHINVEPPYQFVLAALQSYEAKLKYGCDIHIQTDFSDQVGLGSSAAVTVATLSALIYWLNIRLSPLDFVKMARSVVKQVQGVGSGADIAASIYGGLVAYQAQPLFAEKLSVIYPLTALYSGAKTKTAEAIKRVEEYFSSHPSLYRTITSCIGQCAIEGIQEVRKGNWQKLGEIMNIQQGMMDALGVSSFQLRGMVDDLRQQQGIMGAKISGSGFGDCVIGLGELSDKIGYKAKGKNVSPIEVAMSLQGVHCEKI